MRPLQFDPFGEPVAQDLRSLEAAPRSRASRIVLGSGVGLFWSLVLAIVVARAAYYDPDFSEKFGSIAALKSYLQAYFSA